MREHYLLEKADLVAFIEKKYCDDYHKVISPLMLNKSLYILFGYWAIETFTANEGQTKNNDPILFDAKFQAWQYGPVEIDAYAHKQKEHAIDKEVSFEPEITNFLNATLDRVFKKTYYDLVQITRGHNCWVAKYHYADGEPEMMDNKAIAEEFVNLAFAKEA